MTRYRPSQCRIVGAQMPNPVNTSSTPRVAVVSPTLPTCSQVSKSVLRYTGIPGTYSKVDVTRW